MATGLSPEELQRAKDACVAAGYEFEKELGRGAFGVVYKVHREGTDFAIKILSKALFSSPAIKPYLDREMQLQKDLDHRNVIRLYRVIEDDIFAALVMEFADCSLSEYLAKRGRLPESEARAFTRQLVEGLHVLYEAKIAHRDLKPANVLMKQTPYGWVLKRSSSFALRTLSLPSLTTHINEVADFGFAKHAELLTTALGTPLYRAPEIGMANAGYGAEVDLWSLGAMLYQLLEGDYHVKVSTAVELAAKLAEPAPCFYLPPGPYSPLCREFVSSLLTKNPKNRMSFQRLFSHPFVMPVIRVMLLENPPTPFETPVVKVVAVETGDFSAAGYKPTIPTWRKIMTVLTAQLGIPFGDQVIFVDGRIAHADSVVEFSAAEMVAILLTRSRWPQPIPLDADWSAVIPDAKKRQEIRDRRSDSAGGVFSAVESCMSEIQFLTKSCGDCFVRSSRFLQSRSELSPAVASLAEQCRTVAKKAQADQADANRAFSQVRDLCAYVQQLQQDAGGSALSFTGIQIPEDGDIDDGSTSTGPTNIREANTAAFVSIIGRASAIVDEARQQFQRGSQDGIMRAAEALPSLIAETELHLTENRNSLISMAQSCHRAWNRIPALVSMIVSLTEYILILPTIRESASRQHDDLVKRVSPVKAAAADHERILRGAAEKHAAQVAKLIERNPVLHTKVIGPSKIPPSRPSTPPPERPPVPVAPASPATVAAAAAAQPVSPLAVPAPATPPASPELAHQNKQLKVLLTKALEELDLLKKEEEASKQKLEAATKRVEEQQSRAAKEAERAAKIAAEMDALLRTKDDEKKKQDETRDLEQRVLELQQKNFALVKELERCSAETRVLTEQKQRLERELAEQRSLIEFFMSEYKQK